MVKQVYEHHLFCNTCWSTKKCKGIAKSMPKEVPKCTKFRFAGISSYSGPPTKCVEIAKKGAQLGGSSGEIIC